MGLVLFQPHVFYFIIQHLKIAVCVIGAKLSATAKHARTMFNKVLSSRKERRSFSGDHLQMLYSSDFEPSPSFQHSSASPYVGNLNKVLQVMFLSNFSKTVQILFEGFLEGLYVQGFMEKGTETAAKHQ